MTSVIASANEAETWHPAGFRVGRAWALTGVGVRRATAAVVAALVGAAVWAVPSAPVALATVLCLIVLVPAALVDLVDHRLPNGLVLAAAIPVVGAALISALGRGEAASGALGGAALVGVPLLVVHLIAPAGMGFGDVKAATVVGGGVGLLGASVAVLALMVALTSTAAWAVTGRHRSVALGPGLVLGALVAVAANRAAGGTGWVG